jgi:hypothetical protein
MKVFIIAVTIFCVLVILSTFGLMIWIDKTSPSSKYSCSGEGLTLMKFNSYTCVDCCYVEIDGFYEFKFPNWVWNNSKLIIRSGELK